MNELANAMRGLRDLFFPRRCNVCDKILDIDEEGLCHDCFADMPFTFFWDIDENPAYVKLSKRAPIKAAAALFHFRPDAGYNGIMHAIKYGGDRLLGFRLGWLLGDYLKNSGFPQPDAVVPVPLHPLRRFKRGFNQAEVIAEGIAEAMGVETVTCLLSRTRYTHSQVSLPTEEKSGNVSGAFKINRKSAKKMTDKGIRQLLVVDDTMTTGATLGECAAVLSDRFQVCAASLAYSD